MQYAAYVHQEGSHWLAEFPDAPGCQTFADSLAELRESAQEALEGWLEAHLAGGDAPPRPQLRFEAPEGRQLLNVSIGPSLSAALAIRWARQDLGLSQAQLAARLGVTQQQIAKLENPDENPTLATVERAAKALGFKVELTFSAA
jgi:predicted RNase H-like HicB family nuclease/DNA-binding XRE family transcriptional regulator